MSFAFNLIKTFSHGTIDDDDSSDRLSYRITVTLLIISSILVGTKQLVGSPITCWIPAHFTGNHEEYTNSYCWVRNTYYLSNEEYIPRPHEDRNMITYYQWIPLILLTQALFFYMPRLVWANLGRRAGIDLTRVIEAAKVMCSTQEAENHEKMLDSVTGNIHRMLRRRQRYKARATLGIKSCMTRTCCRCAGRYKGNYMITVYLVSKVLFIANVILQIFALNWVLGFEYNMLGFRILADVFRGVEWEATPFPRVTLCDMNIRRLGNVHRYTVQCVLPINLFTEKLYLFLWFWMVIVAILSFIEFFQWIHRVVVWFPQRKNYIKKHLEIAKKTFEDDDIDPEMAEGFVNDYLRQDGVFILRLISRNSSNIVSTMVIDKLFKEYLIWQEYEQQYAKENNIEKQH